MEPPIPRTRGRSAGVLLATFAGALALACASTTPGVGGALGSFLATSPEDRLSAALVAGDNRYLALAGPPVDAPCAPRSWRMRSRHFVVSGTQGPLSEEDERKARDYVCAYNEEMAAVLGEAAP